MSQRAKKKINQTDLRRLMKERKENFTSYEKNIESPLAKYDSAGRLSCIACNDVITAGTLWRQHILSKTHRKNVSERLKRKSTSSSVSQGKKLEKSLDASGTSSHFKTPVDVDQHRTDTVTRLKPNSCSIKAGVIPEYSSSDDDEEGSGEIQSQAKSVTQQTNPTNGLPSDFFDVPAPSNHSVIQPSVATNASSTKETEASNTQEALPEGFFDDPVLDAQARKVEYRDPMEEEWEKFQKTIAEETNVSQNIMEEDVQQSVAERDIHQIDEQMYYLGRVVALQKETEEIKLKVSALKDNKKDEMMEVSPDSDSEDDEQFLKGLLDWRAKKMC